MIEINHPDLSLRQKFEILEISKAGYYRKPGEISALTFY